MSLDVYLGTECPTCGVVPRFEANITHNLAPMAEAAGCYGVVWRPEEHGVACAGDLIPALERAVADMRARPEHYQQFNAPNGWGKYEHFLPWLERYLEACRQFPGATVRVSR